jgi:hypothetical protein
LPLHADLGACTHMGIRCLALGCRSARPARHHRLRCKPGSAHGTVDSLRSMR